MPRASSADALTQLLSAELREALRRRELRLVRPVLGVRHGPHRSRAAGVGRDFRDHRPYVPGDDLRRLDWRAAARSERLMIRRTESEDALSLALLLDASGGMAYGANANQKWRFLGVLGTALAEIARRQGDGVGFELVGPPLPAELGEAADYLRPVASRERVNRLARTVLRVNPTGRADWRAHVEQLGVRLRARSVVVVGSDFLDVAPDGEADPDAAQGALIDQLSLLRARGHEVVLLQVLHRDELTFPWSSSRVIRFEDPRGGLEPLEAPGGDLRDAYLERMRKHLAALDAQCERAGVFVHRVATDVSTTDAVTSLLARLAGIPRPTGATQVVRPAEVGA